MNESIMADNCVFTVVIKLCNLQQLKKSPFLPTAAHIFVSLGDAPEAITLNVVWMEKKRIRCLQIVSQHVPIYLQQFRSYSNCTYRSLHFWFHLETPLRLSRNVLHGWKDNSMFPKRLAACTYLSSIVSELYDAEVNA